MKPLKINSSLLFAALLTCFATHSYADMVITEVDPYGSSSSSTYSADWFELTNTGSSSVDITGWSMLDNHAASNTTNPYASGNTISIGNLTGTNKTFGAAALTLNGSQSIAAGQSVIFVESQNNAASSSTIISNFEKAWFGNNVPSNIIVGTYNDGSGANYGLSQTADMVNIFNGSTSAATLIASVSFGADTGSPIATFDNSAGLNNSTITQKSVIGTNGAFLSASGLEIGSPSAVPEPETFGMLLSGLGLMGFIVRRRKS